MRTMAQPSTGRLAHLTRRVQKEPKKRTKHPLWGRSVRLFSAYSATRHSIILSRERNGLSPDSCHGTDRLQMARFHTQRSTKLYEMIVSPSLEHHFSACEQRRRAKRLLIAAGKGIRQWERCCKNPSPRARIQRDSCSSKPAAMGFSSGRERGSGCCSKGSAAKS